jgi:hypothetical protein
LLLPLPLPPLLLLSSGKGRGKKILLPFQLAVLIGIAITFSVIGGESLQAFAAGVAQGGHVPGKWAFILMFGGLQLFLSMVSFLTHLPVGGFFSAHSWVDCSSSCLC